MANTIIIHSPRQQVTFHASISKLGGLRASTIETTVSVAGSVANHPDDLSRYLFGHAAHIFHAQGFNTTDGCAIALTVTKKVCSQCRKMISGKHTNCDC